MVEHPPRPAEGTLALATELLGATSAIRRIARRAARLVWQDEPLPPAQSELLRLVAAQPGLSVADAAHELRLAPNTVSTLVGRLTAAGLLGRARALEQLPASDRDTLAAALPALLRFAAQLEEESQ